jgi:hypothetical protein
MRGDDRLIPRRHPGESLLGPSLGIWSVLGDAGVQALCRDGTTGVGGAPSGIPPVAAAVTANARRVKGGDDVGKGKNMKKEKKKPKQKKK